ncbi:class II aldolase/adducin family protein [bacterium]|nr:class II aldolase/adducin family protein [bacterium]
MQDLNLIYEQLETAAQRAYARGIQTGSGGNLSARVPGSDQMIVKSSGGSFADCDREGNGFILTDLNGEKIEEVPGRPTREAFLHGLIYQLSPETGGVMHCHSPWAISWSFSHKPLPMITQHLKLKFKCELPVIDVPSPMVRPEDGPLIEKELKANPELPAFILVGHGIVALGKDVLTAEHNAELVEETATIAVLSGLCRNAGLYN